MKKPALRNDVTIKHGALTCPHCGDGTTDINLHQENVRVFTRVHEDGDGTLVTTDGTAATVERVSAAEIYERRDVIEIDFYCEHCHCVEDPRDYNHDFKAVIPELFVLRIYQHKGCTYMNWVTK